jgi:predicted deacetylase
MKKGLIILLIIAILLITLFSIRTLSPKEIDDVTPAFFCAEELLEKNDILFVVPLFNNTPISENPEWCEYILSLNKTLGLHGVYHEFREFETDKNQTYIQKGIDEFKACFGYKPELFKSPQNRISKNNKELIKQNNMVLKTMYNKIIHKVYHCKY